MQNRWSFRICLHNKISIRRRHSQIREEDQDPSIITCPTNITDSLQDKIPCASKLESARIDRLRQLLQINV